MFNNSNNEPIQVGSDLNNATVKDRETYSFTVSSKNEPEMLFFISDKVNRGTKISSYIRYLIEQDMLNSSEDNNVNSNNDVQDKINDVYNIVNGRIVNSLDSMYEKLIGLEYLSKMSVGVSNHVAYQPTTPNYPVDNTVNIEILNRLNTVVSAINNISLTSNSGGSDSSVILSKIDNIIDFLNNTNNTGNCFREINKLISTVNKLTEQVEKQQETIDTLVSTIELQTTLIRNLSVQSSKATIETAVEREIVEYDAAKENARRKAASMIDSEL